MGEIVEQSLIVNEGKVNGVINDYQVSGIFYFDNQVVISVPLTEEFDLNLLSSIQKPSYIKDVRIYKQRLDLLMNADELDLEEITVYLNDVTKLLAFINVKSDETYVERRISKDSKRSLKLVSILIIDIVILNFLMNIVFRLQLGQFLFSPDTINVSFYSSILFGLLSIILLLTNYFIALKLKLVPEFDRANKLKLIKISSITMFIFALLSQYVFVIYTINALERANLFYTPRNFLFCLNYIMNNGWLSIYILNFIAVMVGLTLTLVISFITYRKIKINNR